MRGFSSSLAAAALLLNGAIAGSLQKRVTMNEALKVKDMQSASPSSTSTATASAASASAKADTKIATAGSASVDVASRLTSLGMKSMGQNSKTNNGQCWLGTDGANTNLVKNGASESIVVVLWGTAGSWVNAVTPLITVGLAPGESTTISCGDVTGGMAAIYGNTKMSAFGQIDQTWVEFTFGAYGTVDVSKEVNMSGNAISVVGSKCTTDMNTCVFECKSGNTCMDAGSYVLKNCSPSNGGQSDAAAMNGGCLMGANAALTTTFS